MARLLLSMCKVCHVFFFEPFIFFKRRSFDAHCSDPEKSAAMGTRRQNLIRWTPYMDECLRDLEKSSEAFPSDKVFCQWVRLQKLADDLGAQISTDEISHTDISDQKTQYALKGFERQLVDWEKQKSVEITSCICSFVY